MSLEEYHRKRDFRRTPEPAGGERPRGGEEPLEFVVQKHAASHLHYDFRLELDGALKSWAVPKGPSLDPSVRRLAMHVEDHPLEYGSFEGVIPAGEYGGGTVLLWDRGSWWPEGDPKAAYHRGRLKFRLAGEKLRGKWNLVRMGEREEGKESWLLIKEADAEARAGDDPDIIDERPESVATGRDLDEIAADRDRVWHSNHEGGKRRGGKPGGEPYQPGAVSGARKAALPAEPRAQLATLVSVVPAGDDWLHEIKFDGYRLLSRVSGGSAKLVTRSGKDWTDRFPGIAEAVATLPCDQALLDGEAVVLDQQGVSNFQALQNALGSRRGTGVLYYAFDLLHLDGYDLAGAPVETRKELLAALVAATPGRIIRYSDHVRGKGREFYEQACGMGLEGIISKRADRPYRPGRNTEWVKVKCLQRQEFVVIGFTEPSGSRSAFGALLLAVNDDDGRLVYAGRVGTGFSERSLRELHAKLQPLERKTPPIADPPQGARGRGVHWVTPQLVAEVAFTEWTGDGVIRHPSFQGLRDDKAPGDVVREKPVRVAAAPAARVAKKAAEPRIAGIRITSADRVLYPDVGVTKGVVAAYYEAVADVALPHLLDRPLTLLRCPGGIAEPCFFQKHGGEGMPDLIPRVTIAEQEKTEPYMVIDGLPALVALVQFGVLEFHVWTARRDRLDRPDQIVFDLDPDESLPWRDVVVAALSLRNRLHELGLESFVKTTGGKGLHVVAPLVRRAGWDEVREFTRAVADEFVAREPRRYTATMSKRARKGRVFIDFLRNAYNATAIAAYSTRARPGAPVSLPIAWDELAADAKPPRFTALDVPDRIRRQGDAWPGFADVRQSLTAAMRKAVGSA